jgi:hypothetical protein
MTEVRKDRRQRTESRGQMTEVRKDRRQRTESRGQMTEERGQSTEVGGQNLGKRK